MAQTVEVVGDPSQPATLVLDPDTIDSPVLSFFLKYWREKRGAARLPLRDSFVPKEVREHLGWIVVADALSDFTDFRYRIVGSNVTRYFLANGTGKTIREAFAAWGTEYVEDVVSLNARPCIARLPLRLTGPGSSYDKVHFFPDYDTIYLPYSSDGEVADRIVNIFTFNYREVDKTRPAGVLTG